MKANLGLLILLTCVACNGGGGDGDGGVDGGMGGQGGGAGGQGGGAGGQGGGAGGQGGGMGGQGGGAGGQGGGMGGQGGGMGGQGGGMGGQGGGMGGQGGGMGGQGGGCVPDCSDRMCGPDGCGGECAPGCSDAESCMDGACVPDGCPDGTFECGGACADLLTDTNHCGSCGNACADAWLPQWTEAGLTPENTRLQPVCAQAECTFLCAEDPEVGLPQLGDNPNHCGACGNVCDGAGPGFENGCLEGRCIEVQIIDFEALEDDGRARFPVQLGDGVYRLTTAGPGGVGCSGDTVLILLGDGERVDQNDDADGVPGNCSRIQGEFSANVSYEAVVSGYSGRAIDAGTLVIERL